MEIGGRDSGWEITYSKNVIKVENEKISIALESKPLGWNLTVSSHLSIF